jgi:hypothetical protein
MKFLPRDLEMFDKLRIPLELVEDAGIKRVADCEARENFGIRGGGDMAGLVFPYFEPATMATLRRRCYVRIRRDHPETEAGRQIKKYVSPFGDRKRLYFPPRPHLFSDATIPIVLVEAEKSVLAMTAWSERVGRTLLVIGLGGCWGWRGKVGIKQTAGGERVPEHGPIADLEICRSRKVYVLLDANASSNEGVAAARNQLVRQLRKLGVVEVCVLDLPR